MTKLEVLKLLQELLEHCCAGIGGGDQSWSETKVVDHYALCDKIAREIDRIEHP